MGVSYAKQSASKRDWGGECPLVRLAGEGGVVAELVFSEPASGLEFAFLQGDCRETRDFWFEFPGSGQNASLLLPLNQRLTCPLPFNQKTGNSK